MKITDVKVYNINESILASGYPKSLEMRENVLPNESDLRRAEKLAGVKSGTGHDNFLKGILVSFNIYAPQYFWIQLMRYSHLDIISSQSKMHKILDMNIEDSVNNYVDERIIIILNNIIKQYKSETDQIVKKELFQSIISNTPMGLNLGARVSTNYLQLKTIFLQRKNHKLTEWAYFIDTLMKIIPLNFLIM